MLGKNNYQEEVTSEVQNYVSMRNYYVKSHVHLVIMCLATSSVSQSYFQNLN